MIYINWNTYLYSIINNEKNIENRVMEWRDENDRAWWKNGEK